MLGEITDLIRNGLSGAYLVWIAGGLMLLVLVGLQPIMKNLGFIDEALPLNALVFLTCFGGCLPLVTLLYNILYWKQSILFFSGFLFLFSGILYFGMASSLFNFSLASVLIFFFTTLNIICVKNID